MDALPQNFFGHSTHAKGGVTMFFAPNSWEEVVLRVFFLILVVVGGGYVIDRFCAYIYDLIKTRMTMALPSVSPPKTRRRRTSAAAVGSTGAEQPSPRRRAVRRTEKTV